MIAHVIPKVIFADQDREHLAVEESLVEVSPVGLIS